MAETVWSELNHKVVLDGGGNVKKDVNVNAVISSVSNILGTRISERVMLPEFPGEINNIVFENINDDIIDTLSDEIKFTVERWDPRVSILSVNFFSNPDNNTIEAVLEINIVGYSKVFKINSNLGG
jgi:phage baseplate assembly protein W